jgi:predicted GIY-YIG superfamily endonuclease
MRRCGTPIGMRPVPGELRKHFAIYILTNRPRGVLYTGVTSSIEERVRLQCEGLIDGFTKRYNLKRLVYFEYSQLRPGCHYARETR